MSFRRFIGQFKKTFAQPLTKRQLKGIGDIIIERLRETTDQGTGITKGRIRRLKPLAPSTKKQKRRKGLPTRPRLRETGKMMDSLFHRTNVRKQTATVQVKASQQEKVDFTNEDRPWFPPGKEQLDRKTKKQILDFIEKGLEKRFKKL